MTAIKERSCDHESPPKALVFREPIDSPVMLDDNLTVNTVVAASSCFGRKSLHKLAANEIRPPVLAAVSN